MAGWSAENATNAYLKAVKMGKRAKEPDTAEFISALVAGTNAQLMVVACSGAADFTAVALVAAAHQTGGEVVCVVGGPPEVELSKQTLREFAGDVKFVVGKAENLVKSEYREADCLVVDCRLSNWEGILRSGKGMVLGYNANFQRLRFDLDDVRFLPIGEGLLVGRSRSNKKYVNGVVKRSRWVVKVDEFTREEHVFRVVRWK